MGQTNIYHVWEKMLDIGNCRRKGQDIKFDYKVNIYIFVEIKKLYCQVIKDKMSIGMN